MLGISLVTSKGAHGVPGSAIVVLATTLSASPAIGLVLVLSIVWLSAWRVPGNLIGNCVATVVIAAWEKDPSVLPAKQVLASDVVNVMGGMSATPRAPEQPA